jgi:hypothetical protein
MDQKFAVDPSAFRDAQEAVLLLQKFGFHEGRFLATLPKAWQRLFFETVESFPDGIGKQQAKLLISRLKESGGLVNSGAAYKPDRPWLGNALDNLSELSGVVHGVGEQVADPRCASIEMALLNPDFFRDNRDRQFQASEQGYLAVVARHLEAAPEICLVDPYFDLTKKKNAEVLRAFVYQGTQYRVRSFVVFAHAEKVGITDLSKAIETFMDSISVANWSLRVVLVSDESAEVKFHARYLISKYGGLRFDYGFQMDASRMKKLHDVSVLDRNRHEKLCKEYLDGEHGFEIVTTHTVTR